MGRGLLTAALLVAAISAAASIGSPGPSSAGAERPSAVSDSSGAAERQRNVSSSGQAEGGQAERSEADPAAASVAEEPARQLFAGKVVLLVDALKRRKVETSEEELQGQVVLETESGELIPIVPDWRGRAFFQDERLRNRKVELAGYRPAGTPYLKVLMVFTFDEDGQRQYTDYWCDICSIPMYEIQQCECCQGPIRLRFQPRELPDYLDTDTREGREAGDEPASASAAAAANGDSSP